MIKLITSTMLSAAIMKQYSFVLPFEIAVFSSFSRYLCNGNAFCIFHPGNTN